MEFMPNQFSHSEVLDRLREIAAQADAKNKLPFETVRLLKDNFTRYDWVGIYSLESDDELVLGPFLGKPSPHTRIKVGDGICGAAVREENTIIVDDVNNDPRYLACSLGTKSEIVVPIFKYGIVVGELDIDSDTPAAFSDGDRLFLEKVCEILAAIY
jgi:L-methionine (R)-S-oxide reductase